MSVRALLITLILIPVNSLWMMTACLWNAGYPTTVSLFFNTITYLFILVLINAFLARYSPKRSMSSGEMLLIYSSLTLASALNGLDMLQLIGAMISGPEYLATPENEWREMFIKYIPSWLIVSDASVLQRYAEGDTSLYLIENAMPWVVPAITWSFFTISLVLVMIGLTLVLSSRWVTEEKLSYPIIQLPQHMVQRGFLRDKVMWLGFGIGAFMGAVNGLHFFIPSVPTIGKPINIGRYFTDKPLNAIGWLPIAVHPFAVGLGFFMPVDLSLSCWFFYFFWKFQRVMASAIGVRVSGFPFIDEQTTGAYLGLALVALWMARRHILRVFRSLGRGGAKENKVAILCLAVGMLGILIFCLRAGMSLRAIATFFLIYYLISLAIGRIRAELGSPVHDLHFSGPGRMMVSVFGTRRFAPSDLTIISMFWYFNRAYRSHPMPCILEGMKLGERSDVSPSKVAAFLIIATVFATFSAFWAHLHSAYINGGWGRMWPAYEAFNRLTYWLSTPVVGGIRYISAYSMGGLLVFLLTAFRMRFIWFPLHPVGLVVSSSWAMNPFWFSIFLSWIIKSAVLKYGGLKAYRRNIPFFLGLILGEFIADSGVSIAGTFLKVRTYIWYG